MLHVLHRDQHILLKQQLPRLTQRQDRYEGLDAARPEIAHCVLGEVVEDRSLDLPAQWDIISQLAPHLGDNRQLSCLAQVAKIPAGSLLHIFETGST